MWSSATPTVWSFVQTHILIFKKIFFVKAVSDCVSSGCIVVAYNWITHVLDFAYQCCHTFFAAKTRVNRQKLWKTSVVSAVVPTYKTKFCLVNTLVFEFISNVTNSVKCACNVHFRFCFGSLIFNRTRYRLPTLTNTNFDAFCSLEKSFVIFCTLFQGLTAANSELILTIDAFKARPEFMGIYENIDKAEFVMNLSTENEQKFQDIWTTFKLGM